MKDLTLEDMTKPELIEIIKGSLAYQPTQKQMQWTRWETMVKHSQALMSEAIQEQKVYTGATDVAGHFKWLKASEKFNEGMKFADLADDFLSVIKEG